MLVMTSLFIVAGACREATDSGLVSVKTTCHNDEECTGNLSCDANGDRCDCHAGRKGATCSTIGSQCPPGTKCSIPECQCVPIDSGLPPAPDSGSTETPDAEAGAPEKKACTTNDDCVRSCDCNGDGTMECSYSFACEDGFCYENPPEGGYSYMTCERICLLFC